MKKQISRFNIFNGLQFMIVTIGVIYCFTFNTIHIHQGGLSAHFLNFKMPFINGFFLYLMLGAGIVFSIISQTIHKKFYKSTLLDALFIANIMYHALSLFWVKDVGLGLAALTVSITFYVFYYLLNEVYQCKNSLILKYLYYLLATLTTIFMVHFFITNADVLLKFIYTDDSFQIIISQSKSWVGGKNQTAIFLAMLLPLVVFLNQKKWITISLVCAISVHILIMGSRNAYIALIVFFFIYLLLNKIKKKQWLIAGLLIAFLLLLFGAFVGFDIFINQLKNNTWSSRFQFWEQTLQMGKDHLMLGTGAGQWDFYRLQYGVWFSYKHPHNDLIRSFAELGLLGSLLFYSPIAIVLISTFKQLKQNKKNAAIALSALAVYLSLSFFDELKMKDNYNLLLALLFVIINSKLSIIKLPSKLPQLNAKILHLTLYFVLILSAFCLIIYPIKLQSEMLHYKKYRAHLKQKENDLAINTLKKIDETLVNSINRNPINILIGNMYFNIKAVDSARVYYAKASNKNPYYINEFRGNLQMQVTRNKTYQAWQTLTKIHLTEPCNSVLEKFNIEMPKATKKLRYFKNLVEQERTNCGNELD